MSERKRCSFWGINSYEYNSDSGTVIFPASGSLFQTSTNGTVGFREIKTQFSRFVFIHVKSQCCVVNFQEIMLSYSLNAVMSPSESNLIAFYAQSNIWLFNCGTNTETKLTNFNEMDAKAGHSAGLPSYVMQEEFNR